MSLRLMGTNAHGRASIQSSHVSISTTQVKQSDCNLKALLESGMSGLEVYPNSSLLDWKNHDINNKAKTQLQLLGLQGVPVRALLYPFSLSPFLGNSDIFC